MLTYCCTLDDEKLKVTVTVEMRDTGWWTVQIPPQKLGCGSFLTVNIHVFDLNLLVTK